jgi:hypothetical protein
MAIKIPCTSLNFMDLGYIHAGIDWPHNEVEFFHGAFSLGKQTD